MRVVIHVGMHKTGSSSIQNTFVKNSDPDLHYIHWGGAGNHSGLFVLLFEDVNKLARYHSFKARGKEFTDKLPKLREQWRESVINQLSLAGDKTVIFSAEAISAPRFGKATKRLYEFFQEWTDDISVIGYARNPQSFCSSAFQQRIKGAKVTRLNLKSLGPEYRARFEAIDKVFGRDHVTLKDFSSNKLLNGDVVQDFAQSVGLPIPPEHLSSRANESLSLEATALLFVQRKFGKGFVGDFTGAHVANRAFISALQTIGTQKLSFSDELLHPFLEEIRDDISWIEERIGSDFSEPKNTSKSAISSEADLVKVALQNLEQVQKLTGDKLEKGSRTDMQTLVVSLEQLRGQRYESTGASTKGEALSPITIKSRSGRKDYSMTNTDSTDELDHQMRRILALALWHSDNAGDLPTDADERKAAYAEVKKDYLRKAMLTIRRLERQHISLVLDGEHA